MMKYVIVKVKYVRRKGSEGVNEKGRGVMYMYGIRYGVVRVEKEK
jgi:hypothetical protein